MEIRNKYSIKLFDEKFFKILSDVGCKKKSPIIIIQGGYGKRNTGDDALLNVIAQKVLSKIPNAQIIAFCHFPNDVKARYNINAYHFSSKEALAVLFKADLLIIGGGGIVNKINTYSGLQFFRILDPKGKFLFLTSLLLKLRKKPVVFYVVGMTSIPDVGVKYLMKLTLPKVDLLGVRDPLSLKILEDMNINREIFLTHDPAVDLEAAGDNRAVDILVSEGIDMKKNKVAINLRYVADNEINSNTIDQAAAFIDYMIQNYGESTELIFFPISRHPSKILEDDYRFALEIKERLKSDKNKFKILQNIYKPNEIKALLKQMDMMFLSRLHAVILSFEYKIPTAIISYDDKVEQFGKMIGMEEAIIYLKNLKSMQLIQIFENNFENLR